MDLEVLEKGSCCLGKLDVDASLECLIRIISALSHLKKSCLGKVVRGGGFSGQGCIKGSGTGTGGAVHSGAHLHHCPHLKGPMSAVIFMPARDKWSNRHARLVPPPP